MIKYLIDLLNKLVFPYRNIDRLERRIIRLEYENMKLEDRAGYLARIIESMEHVRIERTIPSRLTVDVSLILCNFDECKTREQVKWTRTCPFDVLNRLFSHHIGDPSFDVADIVTDTGIDEDHYLSTSFVEWLADYATDGQFSRWKEEREQEEFIYV